MSANSYLDVQDKVDPSMGILTNFFLERQAENALKNKVMSNINQTVKTI